MVYMTQHLDIIPPLWDWMTQLMGYHLGLGYIKRPVLNATHCPEEDQCNLVEMYPQNCHYFFCWFKRTRLLHLYPAKNVIMKLIEKVFLVLLQSIFVSYLCIDIAPLCFLCFHVFSFMKILVSITCLDCPNHNTCS